MMMMTHPHQSKSSSSFNNNLFFFILVGVLAAGVCLSVDAKSISSRPLSDISFNPPPTTPSTSNGETDGSSHHHTTSLSEDFKAWAVAGDSIFTPDGIQLTPDSQGKAGQATSILPAATLGNTWRIDATVHLFGDGVTLAGDGLALYYTKTPILLGTSAMPNTDQQVASTRALGGPSSWEGLGLFIDTFDNDGRGKPYPYMSVLVNDGSLLVSHDASSTESALHPHGGCASPSVRQTSTSTTRYLMFRLEYDGEIRKLVGSYRNVNSVQEGHEVSTKRSSSRDDGREDDGSGQQQQQQWTQCFSIDGVTLPPGYFLGASASTGDLTDAHVLSALVVYGEEGGNEDQVASDVRSAWPGHIEALKSVAHANRLHRMQESGTAGGSGSSGSKGGHEDEVEGVPPHEHELPNVPESTGISSSSSESNSGASSEGNSANNYDSNNNNNNNNDDNNNYNVIRNNIDNNNIHEGDSPNSPPHVHEMVSAEQEQQQATGANSGEANRNNNNNDVGMCAPVAPCECPPMPPSCPTCPECPVIPPEFLVPPTVDYQEVDRAVRDSLALRNIRELVSGASIYVDGMKTSLNTRIDESFHKMETLVSRMQTSEVELQLRVQLLEQELLAALESLRQTSESRGSTWVLPFVVLAAFLLLLMGAWVANLQKVKKLHYN